MKKFFLILLMLITALNAATDMREQLIVLDSKQLENSGIVRISDLIFLIDNTHFYTIDGYTWYTVLNGLAPLQQQTPVMLNGRCIEPSFLGVRNMNMLPVSLKNIDSVVIVTTPHIYSGYFAETGLIDIIPKKMQPGFNLSGSFYAGNETGDPGPFKYTDYYSPNVDRIGKGGTVNVSYRSVNFFVRSNFIIEEHILTDFAMRRRIHSASTKGWGSFYRYAPSLEFGFHTGKIRHNFYINHSNAEHYFFFFEELGREIPMDYSILQTGYYGSLRLSANRQLNFSTHYSGNWSEPANNIYQFDFDADLRKWISQIEYHQEGIKFDWRVGGTYEQTSLRTAYKMQENAISMGNFYARFDYQPSPKTRYLLSLMGQFDRSDFATKAAISLQKNFHPNHIIQASLSFSQQLVEEENTFWYWVKNGYRLLDEQELNYFFSSELKNSSRLTSDIYWRWKIHPDLGFEASAFYRKFNNMLLEQQQFFYYAYYCAVRTSTGVFPDNYGRTGGIRMSIKHDPSGGFKQRFDYHYQQAISGNSLFKNEWDKIPTHKAAYQITIEPVKNLSFWLMGSYTSRTHWHDYDPIDGAECTRYAPIEVVYRSKIEQNLNLDFQIKKWFWRRQMTAALIGRNLLNNKIRYHPMGVSHDLSFYINLTYHFNF
ncbi:hypothetical protein GF337_16650 [candidate division KSB1 bacterium]|nr:hypothetical protein [candidate division KSB1 bacterium]